jgi:hypothetical protein
MTNEMIGILDKTERTISILDESMTHATEDA